MEKGRNSEELLKSLAAESSKNGFYAGVGSDYSQFGSLQLEKKSSDGEKIPKVEDDKKSDKSISKKEDFEDLK